MGLWRGDKIKPNGSGYTLEIPSYGDPQMKKIYEEAKAFAGSTTGKKRVAKFLEYVHDAITPVDDWHGQEPTPSLSKAVEKRQGVCKEKAAILGMILSREEIKNEYERGTYQNKLGQHSGSGRHAWLKVEIEGEKYLADPTLKLFGKYDSTSKINGFVEGKNKIER